MRFDGAGLLHLPPRRALADGDPGAVDEDPFLAVGAARGFDRRGEAALVGDVAGQAAAADRGGELGALRLVDVEDGDLDAAGRARAPSPRRAPKRHP